jgi:hypothetical protein
MSRLSISDKSISGLGFFVFGRLTASRRVGRILIGASIEPMDFMNVDLFGFNENASPRPERLLRRRIHVTKNWSIFYKDVRSVTFTKSRRFFDVCEKFLLTTLCE